MKHGLKNVIYLLTCEQGKHYVGQTQCLDSRLRIYAGCHCVNQIKLYRAIKKYGWSYFTVSILEHSLDENLMDERETDWINFYDCIKNGYNCCPVGGNRRGMRGGKFAHLPLIEARAAMLSEYKANNLEKIALANKSYSQNNPEIRAYHSTGYYNRNREKILARKRAHYARTKEYHMQQQRLRRAR